MGEGIGESKNGGIGTKMSWWSWFQRQGVMGCGIYGGSGCPLTWTMDDHIMCSGSSIISSDPSAAGTINCSSSRFVQPALSEYPGLYRYLHSCAMRVYLVLSQLVSKNILGWKQPNNHNAPSSSRLNVSYLQGRWQTRDGHGLGQPMGWVWGGSS